VQREHSPRDKWNGNIQNQHILVQLQRFLVHVDGVIDTTTLRSQNAPQNNTSKRGLDNTHVIVVGEGQNNKTIVPMGVDCDDRLDKIQNYRESKGDVPDKRNTPD